MPKQSRNVNGFTPKNREKHSGRRKPPNPTGNSTKTTDKALPNSPQRLFFALLPSRDVREGLRRLQKEFAPTSGQPVAPENLHLTLLFLGEVRADKTETVRDLAFEVKGFCFELVLDIYGSFGQDHARILWTAPSHPPSELSALHHSLRRKVEQLGLHVEKRVYRPHVTLVRKARVQTKIPGKPNTDISWPARRYALISSERLPTGPRYSVLAEKDLAV